MPKVLFTIGQLDNLHDPVAMGSVGQDGTVPALTEVVNADCGDERMATRRDGRTLKLAATKPHSAMVNPFRGDGYFVEGGLIKLLNANLTTTPVAALANNLPCGYEIINGELIISNGTDIGWLAGADYQPFAARFKDDDPNAEHYRVMFAGRFLAFWQGMLWVANGNLLGFSLPGNATTRDNRFCRIPMDGTLRMLAGVEDGLWVATEKHVSFITGRGPDDLQFRHVSDKVPPYGGFYWGYEEREGGSSRVVAWVSEDGFCEGRAGGAYRNLSQGKVSLPSGSEGLVAHREHKGMSQYLAVIREPVAGNVYQPDSLHVESHNI